MKCVCFLIQYINHRQSEHTALGMAAASAQTAVVEFLLQNGANVHLGDEASSALPKRNTTFFIDFEA